MKSQTSSHVEPASVSARPAIGRLFLRALLVLSLVYYAVLMLDLVLHPLVPDLDGTVADRFLEALTGTGVIVIGVFIMRRVPGNRIGPLLILYGVGVAGYSTREELGSSLFTFIAHLFWALYYCGVALPALFVLLLSFPTGRIYPRWAVRWVTLYVILAVIGSILLIMSQNPVGASFNSLVSLPVNPFFIPAFAPYNNLITLTLPGISLLFFLGVVGVVVSLILRYRASRTREQQQIKWLIWMSGVTFMVGIPFYIFALPPFDLLHALYISPIGYTYVLLFYGLLNTFPAIGIGLAILRSQLWEIDIIINRTLVYGSLTVLLALLYAGLVIGLGTLVHLFTGQALQSPIVIVASTLAIAALFQPLRRRIQDLIDRRFYRRKYDAARTLAAFSATLRTEVELGKICEDLVAVVQETMQPMHISLWVHNPEREEKHKVSWIDYSPAPFDEKSSHLKQMEHLHVQLHQEEQLTLPDANLPS
jgi:hypothetical protein